MMRVSIKKLKEQKKCLMLENYKDCLFKDKTILKSQQRFKINYQNVYMNKSIRLHWAVMMIKDYKHIHMEKKNAKVRC